MWIFSRSHKHTYTHTHTKRASCCCIENDWTRMNNEKLEQIEVIGQIGPAAERKAGYERVSDRCGDEACFDESVSEHEIKEDGRMRENPKENI